MKFLLTLSLGILLSAASFAQVQTFSNIKYRINEYGQFSESSTSTPTRLIVDVSNKTIMLETESSDIQGFVDYNSQFSIISTQGNGNRRVFVTNEGIIFQVEAPARRILIHKRDANIRMSALWLDEIEFK